MPDRPVTKADLDGAIAGAVAQLRGEIGESESRLRGEIGESESRLRGEIGEAKAELRGEIRAVERNLIRHIAEASEHTARVVEERLGLELARHVTASEERNREFLRSLDDRYRDLPPRTAALRRDLDEHLADEARHVVPPAGAADPKR
jgi:hypothetical protein